MLTQIDVVSENPFFVPILGVTPKDSLLIYKITGLNAADIDLFIGEYARDGGNYQGRRVQKRNVVITMELNPNPALGETVSGLRDLLYKTFLDPYVNAQHVKLVLHDDEGRERFLYGYVEKFENDIFSADTMSQISVICPDPYIRDNTKTIMTHPTGWVTVPFTYGGTAQTGFEIEVTMTANSPTLTVSNNGYTMVINDTFLNTQVIYINTNRGSRDMLKASSANLAAARAAHPTMTTEQIWEVLEGLGQTVPLIAKRTATSPWLELHSQSNTLKVYGATTSDIVAAIKRFEYTSAYWGV